MARSEGHRDHYDVVVARAVGSIASLVELLLPLVHVEGWAILMKTASALGDELQGAMAALQALGGDVLSAEEVSIPGLLEDRALVTLRKSSPTPPVYPRRAGVPQRRPIKDRGG